MILIAASLVVPAAADARKHDRDRDGLGDWVERKVHKTNPRKADTDGDKLGDRYELKRTHTNPRRMDTDRDGLADGFEVKRSKTKPRRFDTDRDGVSDGLELLMRRNPLKRERKKPQVVDTDLVPDPPATLDPPALDPPPLPIPDLFPPDTTITSGPSGTVATDDASFGFTSSESNSTFECRMDAGSWGACTSPKSYSNLANGSHTFDVRATDAAGNTDGSPASRTWTVNVPPPDTTAPDTSITAGPSGTSTSSSASFSFTSTESGSTFQCRMDAGSWGACTSPKSYSNLANGSHTFDVRATDAAGNRDSSPASRTWTVAVPPPPPDTTAPDTSITAGPSGTSTSSSASFSFTSTESGSTFECRMDTGAWGSCSSPKSYSNLANGSHTFDVRATDAAGNTDASPASRTWTVDVPAPPPPGPAQVFLSPTGSDSAACTSAAPCKSFARAYAVAQSGNTVSVANGVYPDQNVPTGSKSVTFKGGPGVILRQMSSDADNVTYDGINVDANAQKPAGAAFGISGDGTVVKNASIGNVTDEKAMLAMGSNITIDNVNFHDAVLTPAGQSQDVHMECLYAIGVPGFTIRNSTFRDCAIMDLFFTYGSWWSPQPPAYGNVTVENNVFAHSEDDNNSGWHYYGLYIAWIGPNGAADPMNNWVVRNNTFENEVQIAPDRGSNGTRWVGNIGSWSSCKPGITFRYNVGKACSATDKAVSPAASTSTSAAPMGWVNPSAADFHLKAGSPAIDAGDPADFPAKDRDGKTRTGTPDAGAYEF